MGFKRVEKGIYSYYKNSDPKKKHQCYYISVTGKTGTSTKVKSKFSDIRKVRLERAQLAADVHNKEAKEQELTLNELVPLYINPKTKKPWSDDNQKKFHATFGSNLGQKRASEIADKDIADFIALRESQGLQARADLIRLKAILHFADKKYRINGREPITIPSANKKKKRYFTEAELDTIFDMANRINRELYIFMKTLLYTGQRPKNILDLSISDVDFDRGIIEFDAIKGQEADEIPIHPELSPLLKEQMAKRYSGKLFTYCYDYLKEMAQEIFDVFNKKLYYIEGMTKEEEREARNLAFKRKRNRWVSFYTFRHTRAMMTLNKTGNIFLVKSLLRHTDIKTTMVYVQDDAAKMREAVNAI